MKISDPDELRDVARKLLILRNFRDIRIREAPSSSDGGRDIEASTVGIDDAAMDYTYHWWIELKFVTKGNVKRSGLPDRIHDAAVAGADYFLLITNGTVTGPHQDLLRKAARRHRIRFVLWDKYKLAELIPKLREDDAEILQPGVDFQDREHETALLSGLISCGRLDVLFVRGAGGIGKSALCRHLLWRERRQFRTGQIDARMSHDLGFVLQALAAEFRRQGSRSRFAFTEHQQLQEEERLRLLREHLSSERTLLLIDNFEVLVAPDAHIGVSWARALLQHAVQSDTAGSVVLVTSRVAVADAQLRGSDRFHDLELAGWDLDFIFDRYLPTADHLNTSLAKISDDLTRRKQEIDVLGGNPLALKIANQLCASYDFQHMVSLLPKESDPAQALIEALSARLGTDEISALERFAQFDRPLSSAEIGIYVCDPGVLMHLEARKLVEPLTRERVQFQLHPLTSAHFSLKGRPERRHAVVLALVAAMMARMGEVGASIDETYFHFLMRQAVRMFMDVNEPDRAAEILVRIGTRVVSMGDVGYLQRLLDELRPSASPRLAARLLKAQGHIDDLKTDFAKGRRTYQAMLEAGETLHDTWSVAAALNGLGTMARHGGKRDRAIAYYTESLTRREADGDEIGQSNSHHNLGAVNLEHGDIDLAEHHLRLALKLRKRHRDRFRVSATQVYLAELYCHQGNFARARKDVKSAIRIKQAFDDLVGTLWARLLGVKIELLDPDGDVEIRKHELSWCLDIAQRVGKPRDEMLAQAFSAVHHILAGDQKAATLSLAQAWQLAGQLNDQQAMLIGDLATRVLPSPDLAESAIVVQARALVLRLKI